MLCERVRDKFLRVVDKWLPKIGLARNVLLVKEARELRSSINNRRMMESRHEVELTQARQAADHIAQWWLQVSRDRNLMGSERYGQFIVQCSFTDTFLHGYSGQDNKTAKEMARYVGHYVECELLRTRFLRCY